jgi:type IV pilus assembly protein PilC
MVKMAPCPSCGTPNSVKRTFCYQCGKPLPAGAPTDQGHSGRKPRGEDKPRLDLSLGGISPFFGSFRRVRDAAIFFRKLHDLVRAGLPLVSAFSELAGQGALHYREAALKLRDFASRGERISDGMQLFPALFLPWQVGLVRAGESGGALPEVLEQIASTLETEYKLRLNIIANTWYFYIFVIPGLLLVAPAALAVLSGEPQGGWTPAYLLHRYLQYGSRVIWPAAGAVIVASLLWQIGARLPSWQLAHQRIVLLLPLFGRGARTAALARFTSSLAALWRAGAPISEAVRTSAAASGSRVLARRIEPVLERLLRGEGFADTFARTGLFSRHDLQLLRVGEMSGNMPDAMRRVAAFYSDEASRWAHTLPRIIYLIAFIVYAAVAVWLISIFLRIYIHYAIEKPLQMIDQGT